MSVTCARPTAESDLTTTRSTDRTAPNGTSRDALVLGDPSAIGYAVVLPPVTTDVQTAINAITVKTPFIPYRRSGSEPTTYDTVDEFLEDCPNGETLRPILEQHFDYSG